MSILSVDKISKNYKRIRALSDVSFEVPEKVVFGILGPNGSGKTTLLGIIMNVLKPTSGAYKLFDQEPTHEQRKKIGTLLETPNFYHYLTAVENLRISCAIKNVSTDDIPRVLDLIDLTKRKDSSFSTYSLGMKQRLAIGAALLGDPDVLVLDEPTNGLDPVGIAEIRNLIKKLSAEGKTIIMASHLLDEVEKVCTHVAILKNGKLLASGNVNEIFTNDNMVQIGAEDNSRLIETIMQMPGYTNHEVEGNLVNVFYDAAAISMAGINTYFFEQHIVLTHLQVKKKSLENKFIELTN